MGKKGKITDEGRLQKLAEARKKSLEIRRAKAAERKAAKAKKKEEASKKKKLKGDDYELILQTANEVKTFIDGANIPGIEELKLARCQVSNILC